MCVCPKRDCAQSRGNDSSIVNCKNNRDYNKFDHNNKKKKKQKRNNNDNTNNKNNNNNNSNNSNDNHDNGKLARTKAAPPRACGGVPFTPRFGGIPVGAI